MRKSLITAITTCFFFGRLYGHDVVYSPQPMILTFGGQDGTISVVLVGDEPSPDCQVSASAQPQGAADLVSITPATPQPAPTLILNVHVLRQPQGPSESVRVVGRWISAGIPSPPCIKGVTGNIAITVTVKFTSTGPEPIISSVVNGATFLPGIQAGSWASIFGINLAPDSRTWDSRTEIINGKLPTSLDGVTVTIDGRAATVYYISPSQLNVSPADDAVLGPIDVKVSTAKGTSNPVKAQLQKYSPGFFMFDPQGRKY